MPVKTNCFTCGKSCTKTTAKDRKGNVCKNTFCSRACYLANHTLRRDVKCGACGNVFKVKQSSQKTFCSFACYNRKRYVPDKKCVNCGKKFAPLKKVGTHIARVNSAKLCSKQCAQEWLTNNEERKRKISVAMTGPKHPLWQGGKSALNEISVRGPNWKEQSRKAMDRDGRKCCDCGNSSDLVVHHKVPFHNYDNYTQANKLTNLETLCRPCHGRKENAIKTGKQMVLTLGDRRSGGHHGKCRGHKQHSSKLTEIDVLKIRSDLAERKSVNSIAKTYRVRNNSISSIRDGRSWKHLK